MRSQIKNILKGIIVIIKVILLVLKGPSWPPIVVFVISMGLVFAILYMFYSCLKINNTSSSSIIINDVSNQVIPSRTVVYPQDFWKPSPAQGIELNNTCTICLCEVDNQFTEARFSICCSSQYHPECVSNYWTRIGGIKCPNCRFEISPV